MRPPCSTHRLTLLLYVHLVRVYSYLQVVLTVSVITVTGHNSIPRGIYCVEFRVKRPVRCEKGAKLMSLILTPSCGPTAVEPTPAV